jgi:hypothetical protein
MSNPNEEAVWQAETQLPARQQAVMRLPSPTELARQPPYQQRPVAYSAKYYLVNRESEPLNWRGEGGKFTFPGMIRIRTIPDGSCYFHAISNAFFPPYQSGILNGKAISKADIVRRLRNDLAIRLAQPSDPLNPNSPLNYDLLSNGELRAFAEAMMGEDPDPGVPNYTLEHMQHELMNCGAVDNVYNEFISNQLKKDIYILDGENEDIQFTGGDYSLLYKGRPSIVLYYLPGHYELIGLRRPDGSIQTYFDPNSEFIQAIRERLAQIVH